MPQGQKIILSVTMSTRKGQVKNPDFYLFQATKTTGLPTGVKSEKAKEGAQDFHSRWAILKTSPNTVKTMW